MVSQYTTPHLLLIICQGRFKNVVLWRNKIV